MKWNEYKNWVQITNMTDAFVQVKLISEEGQDYAGIVLSLGIPKQQIPFEKRKYGARFQVRWKTLR